MNVMEPFFIGLDQLRSHKLRASLSILGILISVGSVTGIVSMGDGLQKTVMGQFEQMGGPSLVWVRPPDQWYRKGNSWLRREWEEYLTTDDLKAIENASPFISYAVPMIRSDSQVYYRKVSAPSQVFATTGQFKEVDSFQVDKGRFLSEEDVRGASKVAVIGNDLANDLFSKNEPIGKELKIDGIRYTIVGVVTRKRVFDNSNQRYLAIPITTVQMRVSGNNRVGWITVKADSPEHAGEVAWSIRNIIKRSHTHHEEFRVETGESEIAQFNKIVSIMKMVAGGIAGISLLVGGIGIMNIMLVSVAERTREIGIRMAMGAKRRSILSQFILESIALCLAGGALGVFLGLGIGAGISAYVKSVTHQPFESVVTPGLMLFAVTYSAAIGLFFGVYPAWRASKLDPVEALRYE
ncbi:MAG: ABC transporter permease [Candidatus Latescibacterota bacterium]